LCYWIEEREKIRLAKKAGKPKPWTDDEILQNYRFCNVRRIDDKVSDWLYLNWYRPNKGNRNMVPAIAVARHFNKIETLQALTFPKVWRHEDMKKFLKGQRDAGFTIFNSAYMVRGNDGADKIESVMDSTVKPLLSINSNTWNTESMEAMHSQVHACHGFGSFMAGQVVADARWAIEGEWADRNDWAPIGPGSARGMNRLTESDVNAPLSQQEFLILLRKMIRDCRKKLPESITSRMEAHDYQNCLCELSKYEKALWREGWPKQRYQGV
jgi:hypothetical protein